MNAENGRMFRSAIGGYNKDDVNNYIMEADAKSRDAIEKLNLDIEEAKNTNIELTENIQKLESENEANLSTISSLRAEIEQLKLENNNKTAQNQELFKKNEVYKGQTEAQNTVISNLREEKASLTESIDKKSEEYDKLYADYNALKKSSENASESKAAEIVELNSRIDELNTVNESLQLENSVYQNKIDKLVLESVNTTNQIKNLKESHSAEIEALKAGYENKLAEMTETREKSDDGVAYKLDMYDKISSQIGDILINANRNSDDIISAAKIEAEKILNQAEENAERINQECRENQEEQKIKAEITAKNVNNGISDSANKALNEIKAEFAGNMNSCVKEMQTCISEMQYEANALMAFLEKKQNEMNERLDFYYTGVSDSVEEKLIELESECGIIISNNNEG